MRTDIPADVEKTQAPRNSEQFEHEQAMRAKARAYELGGAACGRPYSSEEILAELFRYHRPTEETIPKFAAINQAAKNFAEIVLQNCPAGADRAVVINCIRNARMFANAAISLNGLSLNS